MSDQGGFDRLLERSRRPQLQAFSISLPFLVAGVLWILFSDQVVAGFAENVTDITFWQTAKGLAFVLLSGVLVHALAARRLRSARDREEAFRTLVEQSIAGVYVVREGRIAYANARMHDLLGRARGALVGLPALDAFGPDDAAALEQHLGEALEEREGRVRHVLTVLPVDGKRSLEIYGVRGRWAGRPAVVGIALDVSEREAMQEELRKVHRSEAIAELTGAVAHDLNNLLTCFLSAVELALDDMSPATPGRGDVELAREAAERGRGLVDELLRFARREVPGVAPVIDLSRTIQELRPLLEHLCGHHLALEIETGSDPLPVRLPTARAEQILVNLTVNARDAAERASTPLLIQAGEHTAEGGRTRIELTVTDRGPGIPEEARAEIFEPFFTTKSHGTGLGLATVRRVVREAGGTVDVETGSGGTTFAMTFPKAEAGVTRVGEIEGARTPVVAEGPTGTPSTVLVAEDDPALRRVVSAALRRSGWKVWQAGNVEEAVRVASRVRPAVVLVDWTLDGGGAPEVDRALASRGVATTTLHTSGHAPEELAERQGAVPFLRKPFSVEELQAAMARAARPRDRASGLD